MPKEDSKSKKKPVVRNIPFTGGNEKPQEIPIHVQGIVTDRGYMPAKVDRDGRLVVIYGQDKDSENKYTDRYDPHARDRPYEPTEVPRKRRIRIPIDVETGTVLVSVVALAGAIALFASNLTGFAVYDLTEMKKNIVGAALALIAIILFFIYVKLSRKRAKNEKPVINNKKKKK